MGLIIKPKTYADNDPIIYSDLNSNWDTIYNLVNGALDNANLATNAAIDPSKISGTALNLTDAQNINGIKTLTVPLNFAQITTPNPPSTSHNSIYFKADGSLYTINSLGIETSLGSNTGWTNTADTFIQVSGTSFKIVGADRTAIYTKGTRVMFVNNSVTVYGVVASSTFSVDTTVTLFYTSDFTIANAAITSPAYSYQASPQGFPGFFNYDADTWSGFSAAPSGGKYVYWVVGRTITVNVSRNAGTSNTSAMTVSLPATAVGGDFHILGTGFDNGSYVANCSPAYITGATLNMYKQTDQQGQWTTSGGKNWTGTFSFLF